MTVELTTPVSASALRPDDLRTLADDLRGHLIDPGDPDYDGARRVWNLAVDRRPAAIVRPTDSADVARAITFARRYELPLAVRGGGHSLAGHGTADGALVLDMRSMKGLTVDLHRRRARAEAGLTAGEYTARAHEAGLATPFGDTASVGIAGITLGGGIGYFARRDGLTIDSLRSVELVAADGRLITASAASHPDLFWALRGGGGNFGVVTALEFDLHPAGTVYGGALFLPPTWTVLREFAMLAAAAAEELTLIANLMPAPPAPFVPPTWVGKPVLALLGVYSGDLEEGVRAFAPFRSLATPIADTVGPMPYPAIYAYTAAASVPQASVARMAFLDAIDDSVIETVLDAAARATSPETIVQIRILGGAMAQVPVDGTAFAHRHAPVWLAAMATHRDADSAPADVAWADSLLSALRPHVVGAYSNFLGDEGEGRIREAYPARTYRRLAEVKATYDTDNVFHLNQNIRPAP